MKQWNRVSQWEEFWFCEKDLPKIYNLGTGWLLFKQAVYQSMHYSPSLLCRTEYLQSMFRVCTEYYVHIESDCKRSGPAVDPNGATLNRYRIGLTARHLTRSDTVQTDQTHVTALACQKAARFEFFFLPHIPTAVSRQWLPTCQTSWNWPDHRYLNEWYINYDPRYKIVFGPFALQVGNNSMAGQVQ